MQTLLKKLLPKKKPREVMFFSNNCWGHSLVIVKQKGKEQRELSGHGFYTPPLMGGTQIKENMLILKQYEDGARLILIKTLNWQQDPRDMFFWTGTRLNEDMLTDEEYTQVKDLCEKHYGNIK